MLGQQTVPAPTDAVALGPCRESPPGGLTHLPAVPLSVNSFQDLWHYMLPGKCYSHNLAAAQETLTGCD